MAGLEPAQLHQAKDLICQVVRALVAENSLLRDDLIRVRRLTVQAADTLRSNFRDIDTAVRESESAEKLMAENKAAYQEIIAALQFEDIVSQVLAHQLERSELSLTVLMQLEEQLHMVDHSTEYQSLLNRTNDQVEKFLSRLSASESVKQQSLNVGEAELF